MLQATLLQEQWLLWSALCELGHALMLRATLLQEQRLLKGMLCRVWHERYAAGNTLVGAETAPDTVA
jgi:hypothetical protein